MRLFVTEKKLKKIQATEAQQDELTLQSLLTGNTVSGKNGVSNEYRTYSAQTIGIYRKYRGQDTIGNWQTRALVDIRSAFISGEGLSVHAKKQATAKWIEKFLIFNKLKGSRFFDFVKTGEMAGKALFVLDKDTKKEQVIVKRIPNYNEGGKKIVYTPVDPSYPDAGVTAQIENKEIDYKNFIFTKVHGLPCEFNDTTTKIGLALFHIDNYDRCMNAMRKNNHLFGRITPFFECEDDGTVAKIAALIKKGWKLGDAMAAKAKMSMVVPNLGALENLKMELQTIAKALSALTGIPVHWLGQVDLMSNRSTAETLYETINNGTVNERAIWAESFYEIILKAQEIAINAGFEDAPKTIDADFEVKIPLIPFTRMLQYIQALSLAYTDDAISLADYTNMLPGVDPYRVKLNKEAEAKEKAKAAETLIKKTNLPNPDMEGEDDERK